MHIRNGRRRILCLAAATPVLSLGAIAKSLSAPRELPIITALQKAMGVLEAEGIPFEAERWTLTVERQKHVWHFAFNARPDKKGRGPVGGFFWIDVLDDGQVSFFQGL